MLDSSGLLWNQRVLSFETGGKSNICLCFLSIKDGEFPEGISEMVGLRWLKLDRTGLKEAPEVLGKLQKLASPSVNERRKTGRDLTPICFALAGTFELEEELCWQGLWRSHFIALPSIPQPEVQQPQELQSPARNLQSGRVDHAGPQSQHFKTSPWRTGEGQVFTSAQFKSQ